LRRLAASAALVGGAAVLLLGALQLTLRASLPPLDGRLGERGLAAPVTLERDAVGVVTVTAASRTDLAFGTGFAHAQDRFFQMDLARRLAAGELSELAGPAALEQDRSTRPFRFREVARRALGEASAEQRALLDAYARGVNAGLESLRSRPWEYWLLLARPAPWRPEDSFLVVYAMWWQLQSGDLARQATRREIDARLGGPVCEGGWKCGLAFLYPPRTAWDAPNVFDEAALRADAARDAADTPVPGPDVLDVRGGVHAELPVQQDGPAERRRTVLRGADATPDIGSNNWAVAGRLTASGAALVASDMHLPLAVPPTWYRMRLRIRGTSTPDLDLNGLTLPGTPALVAGSNGHIAWAFTNSDGRWLDVQTIDCLELDGRMMRTPRGSLPSTIAVETIHVRGAADVRLPVRSVGADILLDADVAAHRCRLASWVAESPAATNMNLLDFERATTTAQALALAPRLGIPEQNLVVGDREGHIGWAIAGRIPARVGREASADLSDRGEWLRSDAAPRLYDPAIGRVWTANSRPIDDPTMLAAIGGADAAVGAQYDLGARAQQVRDALLRIGGHATARDMLSIQLDDRALFLSRWRDLMLSLLDGGALVGHPIRADMRRLVAGWDARADVGSIGYRLVRAYRERVASAVWHMILRPIAAPPPMQFERPLWTLVTRRPIHLLAADYPDWRAFLLAQLDAAAAELSRACGGLERCRWGDAHPVHIRHPLSRAVPFLSSILDLPPLELPGDHDMPRVQDGAFGASERFAVSPGHEEQGYMELPGGQSGHPLSPYYRAGFRAWAEGLPSSFLPGPPQHRLLLQPGGAAVD
jgi:penicillin G amidase